MHNFDEFSTKEKEFLDKVSSTYKIDNSPQVQAMRDLILRTFVPFLKGGVGLELGCADGYMSSRLSKKLSRLDVLDGSQRFIELARKNNPEINFIHSLFEEFKLEKGRSPYDYVFGIYVFEHVLDLDIVLRMIKSVLKPEGLLFVIVPNARALSRQLALHMGLLKDLRGLTENDLNHGHRRVFDRTSLNESLEKIGFKTISQGGIMLKLLADFQMNRLIDDGILKEEHIDGLYRLGLEYPDLCGSLFSICTSAEAGS